MNSSVPSLLDHVNSGDFTRAAAQLPQLQQAVEDGLFPRREALSLLRSAREAALVHRAHLLRSLAILEASRLFALETEQPDPAWLLEG
jgi:hypothetical protein